MDSKYKKTVMNKYEKLQGRLGVIQDKEDEILKQKKQVLQEIAEIEKDVRIIELEERVAELEGEKGADETPEEEVSAPGGYE